MKSSFFQLFKIEETRRRIFTTLGLLLVERLGFQVPIPGMSPEFLTANRDTGSLFGLMSAFSGGAIGQTTIFALGIMPYISASIIFSMLTKISPAIEAIQKEGAAGQKKINQWTRLATVPIAMVQALFIFTGVFHKTPQMIAPDMRSHMFVTLTSPGGRPVRDVGRRLLPSSARTGRVADHHGFGIVARIPWRCSATASGAAEFWQTLCSLLCIGRDHPRRGLHKGHAARADPVRAARAAAGLASNRTTCRSRSPWWA